MDETGLRTLPVPSGPSAAEVLPALLDALAGGPALVPHAAGSPPPVLPHEHAGMPSALALVVGTSGSTGVPKLAMLTADALRASATATHERLGGPGRWLLAMPAQHIAGLQVLVRSVLAGTDPVVLDLTGGFRVDRFVAATSALDPAPVSSDAEGGADRAYTALVPTQLARLLADRAGTEALVRYDAVLLGGAATPARLLSRARAAGARICTTYGMSETAGGCVYDGAALRPATVRLGDDGRISLGGATLAAGYLGRPDLTAAAFVADADGTRWFRTDDVGRLEDGRLHVDGRVDDLINSGGLKVAPRVVEDALLAHLDGVQEAVVVGTPHPEWGQCVSAAVVMAGDPPTVRDVRERLRGILPAHALPQRFVAVAQIPLRGPGKPDRAAVRDLFVFPSANWQDQG